MKSNSYKFQNVRQRKQYVRNYQRHDNNNKNPTTTEKYKFPCKYSAQYVKKKKYPCQSTSQKFLECPGFKKIQKLSEGKRKGAAMWKASDVSKQQQQQKKWMEESNKKMPSKFRRNSNSLPSKSQAKNEGK